MLKLYTWNTPNGYKLPIMLEELGVPYEICPVDIHNGGQMTPAFSALNPNHKIPVLVDEEAEGRPLVMSESGAILIYLAEKYKRLLSKDARNRHVEIQWLMFQMSGIGPMFGQVNHFIAYAPQKIEYGIARYSREAKRLMGILDARLAGVPYLGGEYSIADISTWPWIQKGLSAGFITLADFPHVARWYHTIENRAAVARALKRVDAAALHTANQSVCLSPVGQVRLTI